MKIISSKSEIIFFNFRDFKAKKSLSKSGRSPPNSTHEGERALKFSGPCIKKAYAFFMVPTQPPSHKTVIVSTVERLPTYLRERLSSNPAYNISFILGSFPDDPKGEEGLHLEPGPRRATRRRWRTRGWWDPKDPQLPVLAGPGSAPAADPGPWSRGHRRRRTSAVQHAKQPCKLNPSVKCYVRAFVQGVQEIFFFTIHCNPSLAYIAVRDPQSSQRNAIVQSLLLAGDFLYNQ